MNSNTPDSGYHRLVERLNRLPQGAPPSGSLYAILSILFSPREAELVSLLPVKPFTVKQAAQNWKMNTLEAQNVLEALASRALLLDTVLPDGSRTYVLPPPMAGFFEFALMRKREDLDAKALSELFYQYCTVENDFMYSLFNNQTQVGRIFVNEPLLPDVHVLDYERASEVIRTASTRAVGLCYCRHKAQLAHQNACNAPLEICLTLNGTGDSLIRHGFARSVDAAEGLDLLQQAYAHNLVQFGENVREEVSFICNCCGCCCQALNGARRFSSLRPIYTTNFIPQIDESLCSGCGKCAQTCPLEAMSMVSANDSQQPRRMRARLNEEICLGCGVCVRSCNRQALKLTARPQRVITPLNTTHRLVMMAIEHGTLQDLIFDNRVLWNQRAMAALLGAILRLPPLKQALASQQMKSRYLEALIRRFNV
ncbi:MAG: 4Fe-4S binding protein [Anaerolineae bacterium]|nr:4Fe-4S binding protein [Anaerolineae bacterium]